MHVWPSAQGDHRAAMRGHGPGAAHGRVRWRWTSEHELYMPLVGQDRIFVCERDAVCVLDPAGKQMSRITPGLEVLEHCLLGDAVVVRDEHTIVAYDPGGSRLWQHDLRQIHAMHVGPTQELYVWTVNEGWSLDVHSKVHRFDAEGGLDWTELYPITVPGLLLDTKMACDDEGILYTLICSSVGDGVSGEDVGHNGIAAFSRRGGEWARPLPEIQLCTDLFALASGVVISEFDDHCGVARDGTVVYSEQRGPDASDRVVVEIPGPDIRMLVRPRTVQFPELSMQPAPNHSTLIIQSSFDRAGNRYLAYKYWQGPAQLISLDPKYRLRWYFEVERVGLSGSRPVIGLDNTVLFTQGNTLLAIE